MRRPNASTATSLLCSLLLLCSPLAAVAETGGSPPAGLAEEPAIIQLPPVLISEVQTSAGPGEATKEFIELFNTSDQDIVFEAQDGGQGWQVWYFPASRTVAEDYTAVQLVGTIPAGGHFLLAKGYVDADSNGVADPGYLEGLTVGQQHSFSLAAAGNLWLTGPDAAEPCRLMRYDALAWGTALLGEGTAAANPEGGTSIGRLVDPSGQYVDSARNNLDFATAPAGAVTPGSQNTAIQPVPADPIVGDPETVNAPALINDDACVVEPDDPPQPPGESPPSTTIPPEEPGGQDEDGQPVIPAGNIGLKSPQISELLPNPGPPLTDAADEFIELYNPNDEAFNLSGYVLEVGLTTKRRYTIPSGTVIQPRAFLAFFSAGTNLALSNAGSMAALVDPLGRLLVQSEPYAKAKDGQAWLLANGKWQWTTRPTPNALNVVSTPVVKASGTSKKSTRATSAAGASGSSSGSPDQDLQDSAAVAATAATPLHPGVLALVAASALLYGAYEYRRDVANKVYQLRSNRAARRAARQIAQGR